MMKLLFLLSLSILLWAGQSEKTCYTVQILSEKDTPKNKAYLMSKDYADGCKVMKIGHNQTVRCGCYEHKKEADKKLVSLYDEYVEAYVMSTYKYRFENKVRVPQRKSVAQLKKEKKNSSEIDTKTQCYSVEIVKKEKTKKNIDYLTSQLFPKSCIKMAFKHTISVRCGCYKNKDLVINEYLKLKERYKNTIIKISDAKRFKREQHQRKKSTQKVDNQKYIKKIAELEALIEDLRNTIKQQELYIDNMDDTEEIGNPQEEVKKVIEKKVEPKIKVLPIHKEEKKVVVSEEKNETIKNSAINKEEKLLELPDNFEDEEIIFEDLI